MFRTLVCVFGDALLYLAIIVIVIAGARAFGQTVVLKAKVGKGEIRLQPYQQVELKVKPQDGSALPETGETLNCHVRSLKVAEKDGKSYRATMLECGQYKFEVTNWILTAR